MFCSACKINLLKCLAAIFCCFCFAACYWAETEDNPDNLPLDDSMYPYAGLPRLVIETEDFAGVRDRETEIPSHLQIYGEKAPESEVYELTVRGRGPTNRCRLAERRFAA